jgi:ATP-dependent RNA helicase SUPV3L1/SUV3
LRRDEEVPFRKYSKDDREKPPIRFTNEKGNWVDGEGPKGRIARISDAISFDATLKSRLKAAKEELKHVPLLEQLRKEAEAAGDDPPTFEKIWRRFVRGLVPEREDNVPFFGNESSRQSDTARGLKDAWKQRGQSGLDERIRYSFYAHLTGTRFSPTDIKNQQILADLRYPSEWFPGTRAMHRTIHLHVGPTNSGKTYHALQRLEKADTGVYAGPLRLLAHEVYSRMNAKGRPCHLITGEERRVANFENADADKKDRYLSACTVEMMPLNKTVDVAVIDEIQMIGSAERGWAWTQALMGVKAREVHLCGEERTVPLIREICASLGEKLEIHRYERLSPLKVADASLGGKLSELRKGDCIVSFSVMGIHALRKQIERATGRKVATVYGSLPPETRAQQARLFNDPDNDYDFLVASDAVGMGLNLAIKRIVFEQSSKFDGNQRRTLGVADVKQIAGRAGRYRVADQQNKQDAKPLETEDLAAAKGEPAPAPESTNPLPTPTDPEENETLGLVTTLEAFDFPLIRAAMSSDPEPITTAGLFPPASILERFASYFPPSTPFSYILTRLHELSQMHPRFHLCGLRDQVWVADMIEPITALTIADRNIISMTPASKSDIKIWQDLMPAFARCIAEQTSGSIVDLTELPLEILDAEVSANRDYLRSLEQLHKGVVAYMWLAYRFAGIFTTKALAFHIKALVEGKIEETLRMFSFSEKGRQMLAKKREKELLKGLEEEFAEGEGESEGVEEAGGVEEGREVEEVVLNSEEGRSDVDTVDEEDGGEGEEGIRSGEHLDRQTPLTFGGDRFGGEEELPFEDPEQVDVVAAEDGDNTAATQQEESSVDSFAAWRKHETRVESQGSKEDALDVTLSEAVAEGHEKAIEAAGEQGEGLFDVEGREDLVSVSEVELEEARFVDSNGAPEEIGNPEQDPTNIQAESTSATELCGTESLGDEVVPSRSTETQEATTATPTDSENRGAGDEEALAPTHDAQPQTSLPRGQEDASQRPFAIGVPPKHLHTHLDVETKEVGRDVDSRP